MKHTIPFIQCYLVSAFCEFLTSLVLDEVTNLPRGVYHSALSHSTRPSKDRALAAIPDFILHRHEKNKQPGFRASLAGKGRWLTIDSSQSPT